MAAGTGAGWRRAELTVSYDDGQSWAPAGGTAAPAVLGQALSVLPAAGSALIDTRSSVEVELVNESMWIEARSDAALVGGANLAVLGDELIQFGQVEALGQKRFRLSRLLRGRRGTEWAATAHAVGEVFAVVESQAVRVVEPPVERLGGQATMLANGLGDAPAAIITARTIGGESMRPPSPVHVRAEIRPGGDIAISWVRRSRSGWSWPSGADTPLGEETEAYRLTLSGTGFERIVTVVQPFYLYTAAQQAEDGMTDLLAIAVTQTGTSAPSRPTQIIVGL